MGACGGLLVGDGIGVAVAVPLPVLVALAGGLGGAGVAVPLPVLEALPVVGGGAGVAEADSEGNRTTWGPSMPLAYWHRKMTFTMLRSRSKWSAGRTRSGMAGLFPATHRLNLAVTGRSS